MRRFAILVAWLLLNELQNLLNFADDSKWDPEGGLLYATTSPEA